MTEDKIIENKLEFCSRLRATGRDGVEQLIKWLETTDFFTAPASTQFHESYKGGLVQHSLRVSDSMRIVYDTYARSTKNMINEGSLQLIALLHDLCKTNYYVESTRNVKNDATGKWEKVPFYKVEDQFPMGHGEKSVWLIERYIRLTPAEALAIRWHMGAYDSAFKGGEFAFNAARQYTPLVDLLHAADNFTTLFLGSAG